MITIETNLKATSSAKEIRGIEDPLGTGVIAVRSRSEGRKPLDKTRSNKEKGEVAKLTTQKSGT